MIVQQIRPQGFKPWFPPLLSTKCALLFLFKLNIWLFFTDSEILAIGYLDNYKILEFKFQRDL